MNGVEIFWVGYEFFFTKQKASFGIREFFFSNQWFIGAKTEIRIFL